MAETLSTFSLKPGDSAPSFELPAPDGSLHGFDQVKGASGTLVVFACNHCPFVVMLAEVFGRFAEDLKLKDIGVVAISANDVEKYPQDGPDKMDEFAAEYAWNFPYLYDESQEVAKAYGAACTPDFFLFDQNDQLYYAGQFDHVRPGSGKEPNGSDMRNAVESMLTGQSPPSRQLPSSGCNIKWKPGNAPSYFG